MVAGSKVSCCHISSWLIAVLGMKLQPTTHGCPSYHRVALSTDHRGSAAATEETNRIKTAAKFFIFKRPCLGKPVLAKPFLTNPTELLPRGARWHLARTGTRYHLVPRSTCIQLAYKGRPIIWSSPRFILSSSTSD